MFIVGLWDLTLGSDDRGCVLSEKTLSFCIFVFVKVTCQSDRHQLLFITYIEKKKIS